MHEIDPAIHGPIAGRSFVAPGVEGLSDASGDARRVLPLRFGRQRSAEVLAKLERGTPIDARERVFLASLRLVAEGAIALVAEVARRAQLRIVERRRRSGRTEAARERGTVTTDRVLATI